MSQRIAVTVALLTLAAAVPAVAQNWPSFRGPGARGVADGQNLPIEWDVESGRNVRWKAAIAGSSHASPVVWGDRIFVITTVSERDEPLVLGDEGGISLAEDDSAHRWEIHALHTADGRRLWSQVFHSGRPRTRRHVKSSQANATPATDGRHVAALFGSEGLAVYDFDGELLWRKDLGPLDAGLFGDQTSNWGHASSPILWKDRVFVQVDRHHDSFVAAYRLADGEQLWRVERDEKPVWASPTLHEGSERPELIVVGGDFDRGLDPMTGRELWRFARDFEVKTPTPFVAGDLIVLAGGYRGRELWALRTGATGDVSLPDGQTRSERVAWTSEPGGPYTSTPIAYGDRLYYVRDIGILTSLALADGSRVYQQRLDGTFSASPVASDGALYLPAEDGRVHVVRTGDEFELLASNDMGEPCMASPAIAGGRLFLRTRSHLYAIGR